jgi:hypothetical protein
MGFRLAAFGLHLAGSACALSVVLGGLYLGWYRWPGWYLTHVTHVVGIVVLVDIVIGPTLTLIIANPRKPRRSLARDIAIIVTVQLGALVYGAATLWQGRPLYYTFSADRLEIVQASDIKPAEIALAQAKNPTLAPHWYSRPRWVWAPLPEDPEEAAKIASGTLFGGDDVIDMPRYFRPWQQGLPRLRENLSTVADMRYLSKQEKQALKTRLPQLGASAEQRNALIVWGSTQRLLAIFDPDSLTLKAIIKPG